MSPKQKDAIYNARNAIARARFIAASEVPEPHGARMVEALVKVKETTEAAFNALDPMYDPDDVRDE